MNIDITSKAIKNKLIEVNTTLKFEDKEFFLIFEGFSSWEWYQIMGYQISKISVLVSQISNTVLISLSESKKLVEKVKANSDLLKLYVLSLFIRKEVRLCSPRGNKHFFLSHIY